MTIGLKDGDKMVIYWFIGIREGYGESKVKRIDISTKLFLWSFLTKLNLVHFEESVWSSVSIHTLFTIDMCMTTYNYSLSVDIDNCLFLTCSPSLSYDFTKDNHTGGHTLLGDQISVRGSLSQRPSLYNSFAT